MTIIFLNLIPNWLENDLLIELCESFGEIKIYKRPMNSKGEYLDFLFLKYEDGRSVYYFLKYLKGIKKVEGDNENDDKGDDNEIIVNFIEFDKNLILNDCPDKDIKFKLNIVLNKIKWNLNVKKGLGLLNSGKTLGSLKKNKINELKKKIELKLKEKPGKNDKTRDFIKKYVGE
jgi:hypothetical protein